MAIFGTSYPKFERSGSTVLLEYSKIRPNWVEQNIITIKSVYDHYTTHDNVGDYSDFWVDVNLFKYTSDEAEKFNEIYPYLFTHVYFWPHSDDSAVSGSNGKPIPFFIKEMQHKYHSSDYVQNDILSIHFVSTDYTEINNSTNVGGDIPSYNPGLGSYEIWNEKQLKTFANWPANGLSNSGSYIVMTSFDCSGLTDFHGHPKFNGQFDGNNKTLYNLTNTSTSSLGGFIVSGSGTIRDFTLYNAKLYVSGTGGFGTIYGKYEASASGVFISNTHVISSLASISSSDGGTAFGMLTGYIVDNGIVSTIESSSVQHCIINLLNNSGTSTVACGFSYQNLTGGFETDVYFDQCFVYDVEFYITSSASTGATPSAYAAGFAYDVQDGQISNCYVNNVTFNISASEASAASYGFIKNCGSALHPLWVRNVHLETATGSIANSNYDVICQISNGAYSASYYDFEYSGKKQLTQAMIPLSSSEAILSSSYVGWDFVNIWSSSLDIHGGYPHLRALRGVIK